MEAALSARPRASSDIRNAATPRRPIENNSQANMPKAFESMLKTTTETGDIGLFSIKSPRIHQSLSTPRRTSGNYNENSAQKPRHTFQPYGVPTVDDRRRLPSYARDATSEVVSMYETASQKSTSRASEDPDYRSYSMTQASHSAYTLSNHRSYASLRSQQDDRGPIRRPRSPFAYPVRLRRPGFRPSSPALTDGGIIDYSRRSEIERASGYNASSPSSLYAQKRKPPLTLRPEGIRSTPSLLSRSSPRRASSPYVLTSYGTSAHDGNRRHASSSRNSSPAHSTFSLASTMNLYASIPASNSTTTTPGKPSPLYYDYTEDFEAENYTQSERLGPPPEFQIDKTIPEDAPIGSKTGHALQILTNQAQNGRSSTLPARHTLHETGGLVPRLSKADAMIGCGSVSQSSEDEEAPHIQNEGRTDVRDKQTSRFSRLGHGARELSTHVEEAFGLTPSSSIGVLVPAIRPSLTHQSTQGSTESLSWSKEESSSSPSFENLSPCPNSMTRFSQSALSSDIRIERTIPSDNSTENTADTIDTSYHRSKSPLQDVLDNNEQATSKDTREERKSLESTPPPRSRLPSSRSDSVATDFTGLTDLLRTLEDSHNLQKHHDGSARVIPSERTSMASHTLSDDHTMKNKPLSENNISASQDSLHSREATFRRTVRQVLDRSLNQRQVSRLEIMNVEVLEAKSIEHFSRQIPNYGIARSESPMLAPKPISPARQLKLKNSIPQFMKALPPLPLDQFMRAITPPAQAEKELPFRFSPLSTEGFRTPSPFTDLSGGIEQLPANKSFELVKVERLDTDVSTWEVLQDVPPHDELPSPPSPRKLKLKMRQASSGRSVAPAKSQPWQQAEEVSLFDQNSETRFVCDAAEQKTGVFKYPKFRLKIIRATNSTQGTIPEGTIRINRESVDSANTGKMYFSNAKDLFSPAPGLEKIFRQVSRHLHARKASIGSSHTWNSSPAPEMVQKPGPHCKSTLSPIDQSAAPPKYTGSSETHSCFSEDSSHVQGNHSLRERLSHIRARIIIPYVSRIGTQSYDDITWKDRNAFEVPVPTPTRSVPDLQSGRESIKAKPLRRLAEMIRRHRLKAKVQGWVKGTKFAIKARIRARTAFSRSRGDEMPPKEVRAQD